jgi:hypothetical protein
MAIARVGRYPAAFPDRFTRLEPYSLCFIGCGTITLDMAYSINKKVIIGLGQFRGEAEKE